MKVFLAFPAMIAIALSLVLAGASVLHAWTTMHARQEPIGRAAKEITTRDAPSSYWYGTMDGGLAKTVADRS